VLGEGGIHTIPVGLAEGTVGVRLPNGVGMLRDNLLGLGLFTDTGGLGLLGRPRVHTTVGGTHESTIAAWGTLPSNPLTGGLFGTGLAFAEGGDFLAK